MEPASEKTRQLIIRCDREGRYISMQLGLSILTFMVAAANPTPAIPTLSPEASNVGLQIAQANRVEQICVDAVRSSGYRVNNILSTNTFSGGAEVIMEVRDRSESFVIGCDYSDNTSRIELYQLEDNSYDYSNNDYDNRYGDRYEDRYEDPYAPYDARYEDRQNDRYGDQYDDRYDDWYGDSDDDRYDDRRGRFDDGVRNEGDAEYIARGVVGDQLGIRDPYSDVVRIDDVHRQSNERDWVVEGRVNGAPFMVKIRSSDASILDFELY